MPDLAYTRNHHEVDHAVWTGLPSPYDEHAMQSFPVWYVFEIMPKHNDMEDDMLVVRGKGTDLDVVSAITWEAWCAIAAETPEAAKDRFWMARDQHTIKSDPSGLGHEILNDYPDPEDRYDSFDEMAREHYDDLPPFQQVT